MFAPEAVAPDYAIRAGGLLCLRPQAFRAASSDLVAVPNTLPAYIRRYGSLNVPFGMLFGKGDHVLSPRIHGEATKADFSALDLELIEGGHMLPLTEPERCAALIRRVAARMN
ncbi:MAG: alpha/beta fold hydrolase [Roseiarcus sp.]